MERAVAKQEEQILGRDFETYSHLMDFVTVDPAGAIWHLDHLLEFSNQAFDCREGTTFVGLWLSWSPTSLQRKLSIHSESCKV
jgi:hypothetical protein